MLKKCYKTRKTFNFKFKKFAINILSEKTSQFAMYF